MFDRFRRYAAIAIGGDLVKTPPPIPGEVAFGGPTLLFTDIKKAITTYNPTGLIRTRGYSILHQMRIDDQIKAAMVFKKHAVISTGWEICAPEGKKASWEPVVFVENALKALAGSLNTQLLAAMTCMDYGFSITEKLWEMGAQRVVLAGLKTRAPDWWWFDMDSHGNVLGLRQNNIQMPPEKFIIWTYDKEFDNPYGNSDLLAAYRPWWAKDNAYKFMMILLERMGIPPIFALYNPSAYPTAGAGSTVRADLKKVLNNLQAATSGIIPRPSKDDLDMWTPELANNVARVFIPAIEMMNKDISRALLMPGLLGLTSDSSVGSQARTKVQFDMFMLVIDKIRQDIEEFFMQENIVKPLCDYNFSGIADYPIFKFKPLTDDIRLDLFATWGELIKAGTVRRTNTDENHIRETLQFPPRDKTGADDIEAPAPVSPGSGSVDSTGSKGDAVLGKAPGDAQMFAAKQRFSHVDFAAIKKSLDTVEANAVASLTVAIGSWRDMIKARIAKQYEPTKSWVDFKVPSTAPLVYILKTHLLDVYDLGRKQAVPGRNYEVGVTGASTIAYLRNKADFAVKGMADRIAMQVSLILQNAVKQGKPLGQISVDVDSLFQDYIGDPNLIQDGEQTKPHRVETIIRTNTTDAYNQGRLVQFKEPVTNEMMQAVQFSAVLDDRTTDVCRHLNGRLFHKDDPQLYQFSPPLHFNCRSILIPRFIDETLNADDYITVQDAAKAVDLAGEGFV